VKKRLFLAIELSRETKEELAQFLEDLKRHYFPVRWVAPENIHLTLAFIGWQEKEIANIKNQIAKRLDDISPFTLRISGIGCFPNNRRPRVIWLGLTGDLESLKELQVNIKEGLAKIGVKTEEREFTPHLTLGRVKRDLRPQALIDLGQRVTKLEALEFKSEILADKVCLFESILHPNGPEHRKLEEVQLEQ